MVIFSSNQEGGVFVYLDLLWSTPKCPVLLVLGGCSCICQVLIQSAQYTVLLPVIKSYA